MGNQLLTLILISCLDFDCAVDMGFCVDCLIDLGQFSLVEFLDDFIVCTHFLELLGIGIWRELLGEVGDGFNEGGWYLLLHINLLCRI
jgi:hypothetical protein